MAAYGLAARPPPMGYPGIAAKFALSTPSAVDVEVVRSAPLDRRHVLAIPRRPPAEKAKLYLHCCGQLEAIPVDDITVQSAREAARFAFDFTADQEFDFVDKSGVQLNTNHALGDAVLSGETVYVQLAESAFHDFERQVDQLQHMQIGYLCDQLAILRANNADLHAEIKSVRNEIDQEKGAREQGDEAVRRDMSDLRNFRDRHLEKGESKVESLEAAVFDVKHALHEEALAREQVSHNANRELQEFRDLLCVEGKAREHGDERLRLDIEEMRRSLQLETGDRAEVELRVERAINDFRSALSESKDVRADDAEDYKKQLIDVKSAIAQEQRDRVAADADLAAASKELRFGLQNEVRDRAAEDAKVRELCNEAETTAEAERLARQQAVSELMQQLSIAVESIQEEQKLRSSEDSALSHAVETTRRSVQEERKRVDEVEQMLTRLTQDLSRRLDEEAHARDVDAAKLLRMVSEECESRGKLSRTVAGLQESVAEESDKRMRDDRDSNQRIDRCVASLEMEQKERINAIEELSHGHQQSRSGHRDTRDFAEQIQAALAAEQKDRAAVDAELATALKETRAFVEKEVQLREKGEMTLSRNLAALREAQEESGSAVASKGLSDMAVETTTIREGLAKVVEAVQQERKLRSEASSKLREDCREAIQKEINARLERDASIREELEAEARLRQEAVEVIQLAIEECRTGLETHTHELPVDDGARATR